ncbi:MAG: aminotransferase class IV [Bacteroidota bacterium]|nr:aminotransferase class IV [Bacteroidota bacterium]
MNEHFFIYNDQFFISGNPVISAGNRGLRYGDGLFETMRMYQREILNIDFHFERLFNGLLLLQFEHTKEFTRDFLTKKINDLLHKNNHQKNARIRLMVFRGDGGIFDEENSFPDYIIETSPLDEKIELNSNGLVVDVFPDVRKSCDRFSNLKSNNYLPFVMSGLFAKKNNFNDAIILNSFDRVCESSIANAFIIKNKNIYTPPLSEGCVAGVMRRWMLEKFSLEKYIVIEKNLLIDDLLKADEFFLTNSIQPIRWVKKFREKIYGNEESTKVFQNIMQSIL